MEAPLKGCITMLGGYIEQDYSKVLPPIASGKRTPLYEHFIRIQHYEMGVVEFFPESRTAMPQQC